MANNIVFKLEEDPVPIVLIFHTLLAKAISNHAHAALIPSVQGCFSLASTTDPQALTIAIEGNTITLSHGVSPSAMIVIRLDFMKMTDPDHKPSIEGLVRHPLYAYRVGKFLNFPASNWLADAEHFWSITHSLGGMPGAIRFINTDEDRDLVVGDGEAVIEIGGSTESLTGLLTGASVLIIELMGGNLTVKGSLQYVTILSGATFRLMLGELDRD